MIDYVSQKLMLFIIETKTGTNRKVEQCDNVHDIHLNCLFRNVNVLLQSIEFIDMRTSVYMHNNVMT